MDQSNVTDPSLLELFFSSCYSFNYEKVSSASQTNFQLLKDGRMDSSTTKIETTTTSQTTTSPSLPFDRIRNQQRRNQTTVTTETDYDHMRTD